MIALTDKLLTRLVIAAIALTLCYVEVFWNLATLWSTNSTYSYGFAVPLISGYIVWTRWSELKAAYSTPDYGRGVALLVVGVTMLTVGHLGALMSLEGASLIPTLLGLVLLLGGRDVLRAIWFPLVYLILMLPVWSYLFRSLEPPSQHLSATIGTWLLGASGIPTLQQGTRIILSSASLDVMPECSGINQLIALSVMALPAAYLWLETLTTRIALIWIALVVGYLSNGARIAVLGLLTVKGVNVSDGHSPIHLLPGFLTASLAYLIIWGCLSLFLRFKAPAQARDVAPVSSDARTNFARRPWIEAVMLGLLICASAAQLLAIADVRSSHEVQSLPKTIGNWTMESNADPESARFLGFDADLVGGYAPSEQRRMTATDSQILRSYRNGAGRVQLYVGYYARQGDGKELAGDISRGLERAKSTVLLTTSASSLTVSEVVQRKDDQTDGLVFWYDVNGRVVESLYKAKAYSLWDTITRRRSNGAIVMIAWDSKDGGESAREQALAFAEALLPVLRSHLPS